MTWGSVLAAIFALSWVPLFVCRAEDIGASWPAYRGAERFWVGVTPVLLTLHITAACVLLSRIAAPGLVPTLLGLGVAAVAMVFWFWGRVQIGPLRVRRLPDEPPLRLRRDGAFGLVRHPLYFAYVLACVAPVLVAQRGVLLVTLALSVTSVVMRAIQEERRMHAQLGDEYAAYCREVRRLVPFVW